MTTYDLKTIRDLENYKLINELDKTVRSQYKQDFISPPIQNIIQQYIQYDENIEHQCHDCKKLLLIDDMYKCNARKRINTWSNNLVRCNKQLCKKCCSKKIYNSITGSFIRSCKDCFHQNPNICNKCNKKIKRNQPLIKCDFCNLKQCQKCSGPIRKIIRPVTRKFHLGFGNYETVQVVDQNMPKKPCCSKCFGKVNGKVQTIIF